MTPSLLNALAWGKTMVPIVKSGLPNAVYDRIPRPPCGCCPGGVLPNDEDDTTYGPLPPFARTLIPGDGGEEYVYKDLSQGHYGGHWVSRLVSTPGMEDTVWTVSFGEAGGSDGINVYIMPPGEKYDPLEVEMYCDGSYLYAPTGEGDGYVLRRSPDVKSPIIDAVNAIFANDI